MSFRLLGKKVFFILGMSLLTVACKQQTADEQAINSETSANQEKVAVLDSAVNAIAATGRVELLPKVSFSPVRGVVCESTGGEPGQTTGICYDVNGPSIAYTQIYLSEVAAAMLNSEFQSGMPVPGEPFTTLLGLTCAPAKKQCHATDESALDDENVVRYNTALYAFQAPPAPPIMAPPAPKPPIQSSVD